MTDSNGHSTRANSKVSDPSRQELIHTSCRSESSNISLVVLDKEDGSQQALPRHHSRPALGGIGVKFVRVAGDVSGNVGSQATAVMARDRLAHV